MSPEAIEKYMMINERTINQVIVRKQILYVEDQYYNNNLIKSNFEEEFNDLSHILTFDLVQIVLNKYDYKPGISISFEGADLVLFVEPDNKARLFTAEQKRHMHRRAIKGRSISKQFKDKPVEYLRKYINILTESFDFSILN